MATALPRVIDGHGKLIGLGDLVEQIGEHNPNKGALAKNALKRGRVVGLGLTRAEVYFGEHRLVTGERVTRMVAGAYLHIIPED